MNAQRDDVFTPAIGMRLVSLDDPNRKAIVLAARKQRRTTMNLYSVRVRTDDGEEFTSLNSCWKLEGT